jgi:hypothetical protein
MSKRRANQRLIQRAIGKQWLDNVVQRRTSHGGRIVRGKAMKNSLILAILLVWGAEYLSADPIYIQQPTPAYLAGTTLLPITDPEGSIISSISDSVLTISFWSAVSPIVMDVNSVPGSWATWGSPPNTESATPMVVKPDDFPGETDLLYEFSAPLLTFGMELEPDDLGQHTITANFLFGGNSVGVLPLSVSGNGGALLFAATGGPFDSVDVSSDVDFAAAQFRYTASDGSITATPEPAGGVFVLGLIFVVTSILAKRVIL